MLKDDDAAKTLFKLNFQVLTALSNYCFERHAIWGAEEKQVTILAVYFANKYKFVFDDDEMKVCCSGLSKKKAARLINGYGLQDVKT